jgi:hypothetical protein
MRKGSRIITMRGEKSRLPHMIMEKRLNNM